MLYSSLKASVSIGVPLIVRTKVISDTTFKSIGSLDQYRSVYFFRVSMTIRISYQ